MRDGQEVMQQCGVGEKNGLAQGGDCHRCIHSEECYTPSTPSDFLERSCARKGVIVALWFRLSQPQRGRHLTFNLTPVALGCIVEVIPGCDGCGVGC